MSDRAHLERLRTVRHVALDMDGTIYLGSTVFDCTQPFLRFLMERGIGFSFLTNNNSRSRAEYLRKLESMGIAASAEQMFLSTDATIGYLRSELAQSRRLYVVGTEGLKQDLRDAGFEIVGEDPQVVVVGFDTDLRYESLCGACYWVSRGRPFVATHPDRICPTDQQTVLPDCGAICAAIESATGRRPDVVCGKPNGWMLRSIAEKQDVAIEQIALIGDRIYTDMRMAHEVGAVGVLVLSGEATAEDAAASDWPSVVVNDLAELQAMWRRAVDGGDA